MSDPERTAQPRNAVPLLETLGLAEEATRYDTDKNPHTRAPRPSGGGVPGLDNLAQGRREAFQDVAGIMQVSIHELVVDYSRSSSTFQQEQFDVGDGARSKDGVRVVAFV